MGVFQGQVLGGFKDLYHRLVLIDFHDTAKPSVFAVRNDFHNFIIGRALDALQNDEGTVHRLQAQIFYCHYFLQS